MKRNILTRVAALVLATMVFATPMAEPIRRHALESADSGCSRDYLTGLVTQVLGSMVAHDPYSLPLASTYKATENSHPAALSFMTSWRTITRTGLPTILALDTTQCSAYFALDISEGNDATQAVLRGRVKLVDQRISEIELFINRGRGDHGFSFSPEELAANNAVLMNPPTNRTNPSRATLEALSQALFARSSNFSVNVNDNCQFTEIGWKVVDTGVWGNNSSPEVPCSWPPEHPIDDNARVGLVIDEELGFVLTSGVVPGKVYPYNGNISAFIPDDLSVAQEAQEVWIKAQDGLSLLAPTEATGDTLELLQYYDDELQAMQINVYLGGPNATSVWL
ncbi:hypothetical protein FDECE_4127 [Fusarium decemcellulare]|nr:hypothetical protein FDECE_4127 [Fusarium decemcellulare]